MMEVFIAYGKLNDIGPLKDTLEAWDVLDDAEPVALECTSSKFEMIRRVTAENLATGDYILCDLGYGPASNDVIERAEGLLRDNPSVGIFSIESSVFICRKGIVSKWPEKQTQYYLAEHKQAYRLAGYGAMDCSEAYSRPLALSS